MLILFYNSIYTTINLDYYVNTNLNNHELFTNDNLKTILNTDQDIQFNNNNIISFNYKSSVTGIKVNSNMTLIKDYDKFKIQIDNYYMNNTIIFNKEYQDTLHINLISKTNMNIPKYIHKKILNKKINQIIILLHKL